MGLLKLVVTFYVTVAMTTLLVNFLSAQRDICGDDQVPLEGYFCGRGINRRECPSTHYCNIAYDDTYAVCCPKRQKRDVEMIQRSTNKPGSCPLSSGTIGICIAQCSTDSDCPDDHKCCGTCPRQCSQAIF